MKKKEIVICDQEESYVERLGRFFERQAGNLFSVHGFTDPAVLSQFLNEKPADILLVGQAMVSPALDPLLENNCRAVLLLSDSPEENDQRVVYRYQSAENLLRRALAVYEETLSPAETEKRLRADIFGVYSPVKRCGKTTFSLFLGQLLAEKAATLYLNLEDCAGLPLLTAGEGEENLSDLLYYYRVQQPGHLNLYQVARRIGKLAYIPPVVCPEDIREAEPEELVKVITAIGAREEYPFLVIDLGDALRDPLPILHLCRTVYMPVREDPVSRARVEAFDRWLKSRGAGELLARVRPLVLPESLYRGTGNESESVGTNGSWGQVVRKLLREDGI